MHEKTILWGPKWSNQYSNVIITMQRSNRGNIHLSILGRLNSNEKYNFQLLIRYSLINYLFDHYVYHQKVIWFLLPHNTHHHKQQAFEFYEENGMTLITRTLVLYIPINSRSYVPARHWFTRNFFPDHIQIRNWWKKSSGIKICCLPFSIIECISKNIWIIVTNLCKCDFR